MCCTETLTACVCIRVNTNRQDTVQDYDINSCGDWGNVRALRRYKLNTPQLESFVRVSNIPCSAHQQAVLKEAQGKLAHVWTLLPSGAAGPDGTIMPAVQHKLSLLQQRRPTDC